MFRKDNPKSQLDKIKKNQTFLVFLDFLDIMEGKFIYDNTRYEPTALSICILSDQTF